jgi:diguanylate cyclase (GGDEF)-like protein
MRRALSFLFMLSLIETLGRQGRGVLFLWGMAQVAAVAALSYVAGPTLTIPLLYVVPVIVIGWFAGHVAGFSLSALATGAWLAIDLAHGAPADFAYWNALIHLGVLLALTYFLAALNVALQYARTDYLTGVANGRAFYDTTQAELARARRYGSAFTLVYLDVDDLQRVNETFGHYVGDALIRSVAATLRKSLRSTDLVARLGADDFAVLLPETSAESAQGVLRKLETVLVETAQKSQWSSSFSIGAVTFTSPPDTVEGALNRAEDLMQAAKKADRKSTNVHWQLQAVAGTSVRGMWS